MSRRIDYTHWGNTKHLVIPGYAMNDGINTRIARVAFGIARANRLVSIGIREDCYSPDGQVFELTFGTRCRTGGYDIRATLWVLVPPRKGS